MEKEADLDVIESGAENRLEMSDTKGLVELLVRRAGQFQEEEVRKRFVRTFIKGNEGLVDYVISESDYIISKQNFDEAKALMMKRENLRRRADQKHTNQVLDRSIAARNVYERLRNGEDVDIMSEAFSMTPDRHNAVSDAADISRRVLLKSIDDGYCGNPFAKRSK